MADPNSPTGDQMASALQALGIRFLGDIIGSASDLASHPARLIAALAESSEARLRLALIPLFLQRPEFAVHARYVAGTLSPTARLVLQCYYTAAVCILQQGIQRPENLQRLPDIFSLELGLQLGSDPQANLARLAARQRVLSGAPINWLGTYQHAAQIWLKGLALQEV